MDEKQERIRELIRKATNDVEKVYFDGFVYGLKLARKIIERQREHMPVSEAIDDATVTYLARISDEIARREPGHDKPANSF
jgi:hypothetical protein